MKERLKQLQARVDALTVRERAILFLTVTGLLFVMADTFFLTPKLRQQSELTKRAIADKQKIQTMQAEIQLLIASQTADPNVALRTKLASLRQQSADLKAELLGMQKGLVSPDKMASLLEDILRRNGRLRLVALKTIPVTPLLDTPDKAKMPAKATNASNPTANPAAPPGAAPAGKTESPMHKANLGTVYKHAVELTVEGNYLDMMSYLALLESMPWQLFWGKAQLNAPENGKPTLTLTLFTLSLDQTWLNI